RCFLDAISGTTPPYREWVSICDEMTLEHISLPFFETAAAVSSQELSIPKIMISFFIFSTSLFSHTKITEYAIYNFFIHTHSRDASQLLNCSHKINKQTIHRHLSQKRFFCGTYRL